MRSRASRLEPRFGAKPPSSPRPVDRPRSFSTRLEGVVDLGAPAQRLGEGLRADRGDHELLDVDVGVGVRAAVEDVHHRDGQHVRVRAAEVAEQRQVGGLGGGVRDGQRDAEDGVGAERGLVGGGVQVEHRLVDQALLGGVVADELRADLLDDGEDGLLDALAAGSGSCRRRGARGPRRRRWRRRTGRRHGRCCRRRGRPRPRRWGCLASRGFRGLRRRRWTARVSPSGCLSSFAGRA